MYGKMHEIRAGMGLQKKKKKSAPVLLAEVLR
jgi:hypothetical protein